MDSTGVRTPDRASTAGKARENFLGQADTHQAAAHSAVYEADALLLGQHAEVVARGVDVQSGDAAQRAPRDANGERAAQVRSANQVVIDGAFVRAQAQRGDEPVFNRAPQPGHRRTAGQGRYPKLGQGRHRVIWKRMYTVQYSIK